MKTEYDAIVVGGGQAGLAMGYHLARRNIDFVILDAGQRTGDAWRSRWDSLTLFTPAEYSALPGLPFPAPRGHMPRKDEVAGYLEAYAQQFELPIRHGERVLRASAGSDRRFRIETNARVYQADQIVVATGPFQTPVIPAFASHLAGDVAQIHSSDDRSPVQLPAGPVLVVGGGNSGVQIATELAASRETWLAVSTELPAMPERFLGRSLFWWLERLGMMSVNVHSRVGRKASSREFIIGLAAKKAAQQHGFRLAGRVARAEGRTVFTSEGTAINPGAIVWATGYRRSFDWLELPVFDEEGRPLQTRGVAAVDGVYFLGLPWQHTRGSSLIGWVGRDAEYLAPLIQTAAARARRDVANRTTAIR